MYGLLDLSFWGYVIATLVMTHITIVGVTVFLHRGQAHHALEMHPALAHFFRFWLWLTTGMITKAWAAIHRKHHARCETAEDPHSPKILGLKKVLLEGAELYRSEAKNPETLEKYGHGTPDDWIERRVYTPYSGYGIRLLFIINLLLFGLPGITIWAIQMAWIPFFAAGIINGVGHFWGYRNYECPDAATNISPWGILIGGEELHNNHHAFPTSAKLSSKPWEFDIGWFYIRLFEILGLAKVKKIAPEPVMVSNKQVVDIETLKAIIVNRLHVMAHYNKKVLSPVMRDEIAQADTSWQRLLRKGRRALRRNEILIDTQQRAHLNNILQRSQTLHTVYEYRQKLQEIWARSTTTPESLVHHLQEWCRQAEATGNAYLQNFARTLPHYSTVKIGNT